MTREYLSALKSDLKSDLKNTDEISTNTENYISTGQIIMLANIADELHELNENLGMLPKIVNELHELNKNLERIRREI